MKKIIVLALSVMMLLTCAAAYAGEAEKQSVTMAGAFSISYDKLPEYYTLEKVHDDELQFTALIRSTDAAKPNMILDISFSDEWAGIDTLADVTEQDILELQEDFYRVTELDAGDLVFSDAETGMGTKLMVARDKDGSMGAVYCIYKGHEVEIDLFPGAAGNPVTEEDIQTVIRFLTDIEFTPLEAAQ